MKREITITLESERAVDIGGDRGADDNWCAGCGAYRPMLTVEMAAALACLGPGAIHYWIQSAAFHYQQVRVGQPRICERSFIEHLKKLNFLPRPRRRDATGQTAE